MKGKSFRGGAAVLLSIALFIFIAANPAGAAGVKDILSEAYDDRVALEGDGLFKGMNLTEEEGGLVRSGLEMMVEAGYPETSALAYIRLAETLAAAGISLKDLTNKVREGIAKKVPPERVSSALDRRAQALREARVQVIACEDQGVVFLDRQMAYSVFADYLSRGIPAEKLRSCLAQGNLDEFPALANLVR